MVLDQSIHNQGSMTLIFFYFFFYLMSMVLLCNFAFLYNFFNLKPSDDFRLFNNISILLLTGLPPMPTFFLKVIILFKVLYFCNAITSIICLVLFFIFWVFSIKYILNSHLNISNDIISKPKDHFFLLFSVFSIIIFFFFNFSSILIIMNTLIYL